MGTGGSGETPAIEHHSESDGVGASDWSTNLESVHRVVSLSDGPDHVCLKRPYLFPTGAHDYPGWVCKVLGTQDRAGAHPSMGIRKATTHPSASDSFGSWSSNGAWLTWSALEEQQEEDTQGQNSCVVAEVSLHAGVSTTQESTDLH